MNGDFDGWIPVNEEWTYASADSPTFTFTISGDKTDKYSPGMKIKLTQTDDEYFIITAVSYSSPNTTVTVYGGTDYELADADITFPYYSFVQAPFGFPFDPTKWTVEISADTIVSQANPTPNTWYNLDSLSIIIPLGLWNVQCLIPAYITCSTDTSTASFTLSTSTSSESDPDFTSMLGGTGGNYALGASVSKNKILSLTSKTTYYAIEKVDVAVSELTLLSSYSKLFIRAVCAYL